jgi:exonuclease III
MKGLIWNISGLNEPGRKLCLEKLFRDQKVDFVGIQATKMSDFSPWFLKNLSCPTSFMWHFLTEKKIAGGILVGVRDEKFSVSGVKI